MCAVRSRWGKSGHIAGIAFQWRFDPTRTSAGSSEQAPLRISHFVPFDLAIVVHFGHRVCVAYRSLGALRVRVRASPDTNITDRKARRQAVTFKAETRSSYIGPFRLCQLFPTDFNDFLVHSGHGGAADGRVSGVYRRPRRALSGIRTSGLRHRCRGDRSGKAPCR
jgi:hypothetical protein